MSSGAQRLRAAYGALDPDQRFAAGAAIAPQQTSMAATATTWVLARRGVADVRYRLST